MSNSKKYGHVQCITCGTHIDVNRELAVLLAELLRLLQSAREPHERNEIYADFTDSLFALGYKYVPMPDES